MVKIIIIFYVLSIAYLLLFSKNVIFLPFIELNNQYLCYKLLNRNLHLFKSFSYIEKIEKKTVIIIGNVSML